jgi:hypothetical protein
MYVTNVKGSTNLQKYRLIIKFGSIQFITLIINVEHVWSTKTPKTVINICRLL